MRGNFENTVVHIARWHTKWILGAIFREAADSTSVKPIWRIYATSRRDYFDFKVIRSKILNRTGSLNIYTHQDTFFSVFQNNPNQISERRNRVYFTHFNEGHSLSIQEINALKYCERILVQNEGMRSYLLANGIRPEKIVKIPGAVDRRVFSPASKPSDKKYVLFSGDFKHRKNPELIAEVILSMKNIDFVIHGRNWEVFPKKLFENSSNLTVLDFEFTQHPDLIRKASAYVSLSLIEGGPYSVLEALASGTPVVATNTGFCSEFIDSSNGVLLPNFPKLREVETAIVKAVGLKEQVWRQDLLKGKWQWQELGRLIYG